MPPPRIAFCAGSARKPELRFPQLPCRVFLVPARRYLGIGSCRVSTGVRLSGRTPVLPKGVRYRLGIPSGPPKRPLNELDRALPSGPLQDLAAVHRVVTQLKRRLKTQGQESRGHRRHAHVDVRRTMRASLETGGVPVPVSTPKPPASMIPLPLPSAAFTVARAAASPPSRAAASARLIVPSWSVSKMLSSLA